MKYAKTSNPALLAGLLACGLAVSLASAQTSAPAAPAAKTPGAAAAAPASPTSHVEPGQLDARAQRYYGMVWGIDSLTVKLVESGEIIRFNYRVVDADKAKAIADKKSTPSLIDPSAGVKLVVPELEQVGMLRQTSTPEVGKSYWMAFSNSGHIVKRGDQVNVVIGLFRANALVVE